MVCLDCGFTEFRVEGAELRLLAEESLLSTPRFLVVFPSVENQYAALLTVVHRSLYCWQKAMRGIRLQQVSLCASGECRGPDLSVIVLGHENDSRTGRHFPNTFSGFDSVQNRHSNIQKNNIRPQFYGSLDGLQSVACLADDMPICPRLQYGAKSDSPRG